jgi:hypothetical protein
MSRAPYKSLLRTTIMSVHKVNARWLTSTRVQEMVKDRVIWEDDVETFELINHAEAKHCYAWSIETGEGTAVLTALKIPPVVSPQTAVHEAFSEGKMDPKRIHLKK